MIIIMCGLPASGKSTLVDLVFDDSTKVIRPEDYVPQNADKLDTEVYKSIKIAAWNVAIDLFREEAHDGKLSDIIVLDMCNRDIAAIISILRFARARGHEVILLYLNSSREACIRRSGLAPDIIDKYIDSLKDSLPKYKVECNNFMVARNKGNLQDLTEQADKIRDKLCLNT